MHLCLSRIHCCQVGIQVGIQYLTWSFIASWSHWNSSKVKVSQNNGEIQAQAPSQKISVTSQSSYDTI